MSYYILTSGINFKIHKNIFLSFESSNENNENNENSENIIVDILPPSEQEVKPDAVSTNVSNVPYLLHYDINEHEGMM